MSTATEAELQRTIGRLEAQVGTLESQVSTMQTQLTEIHNVVMRAQGSWKAMVACAGITAFVTGVVFKTIAALGVSR